MNPPKPHAVLVSRFCNLCYHEWSEMADRERLRKIIENSSLDCPKCSGKNISSTLGLSEGGNV